MVLISNSKDFVDGLSISVPPMTDWASLWSSWANRMTNMMVYLVTLLSPWTLRLASPANDGDKAANSKAIKWPQDERPSFQIGWGGWRLQFDPSFTANRQVQLYSQCNRTATPMVGAIAAMLIGQILDKKVKKLLAATFSQTTGLQTADQHGWRRGWVNAPSMGIELATNWPIASWVWHCPTEQWLIYSKKDWTWYLLTTKEHFFIC